MTRLRTPLAAVGAVLLAALALTACGAGGSDSGGAPSQADSAAKAAPERGSAADGEAGQPGGSVAGDSNGGRDQQAAPAIPSEHLVRTADMSLRAKDVPAAAAHVRTIAETAKGYVSDEQTTLTPGGPPAPGADMADRGYSQSVLTLRVPGEGLDRVMQQVGDLGTVLNRSQSSKDVTSQYIDTSSRVQSQTASVERVRALLARATKLGDIVQIEGELARREADLESLQSQLKSLQDKTSLSTLTVTIIPPDAAFTPASDDDGFLAGLSAGWSALVASATVLATVVGALVPFAVLVALVGYPLWVRLRRQRRARPGAGAPPSGPEPSPVP